MGFNTPGDKLPIKKKWNEPFFMSNGDEKENQPYILDLVTLQRLFIQGLPIDGVRIKPESSWATISSPGRNIPLYQYTGGEDIISFTISWYATKENKQDVLAKCKWLHALSRNNNYDEPPHHIKFCFGEMFRESKYIVYSAEYKIFNFDRPSGMYPCYATQDIELRKISETNLSLDHYHKIDT